MSYIQQRFKAQSLRNRKVYSFKSVGETALSIKEQQDLIAPVELPIGIKTPLQLGLTSLFSMNTKIGPQIADNLRNLIQTNHGERLGLYDFGANLGELVFEFGDEDFEVEAISRIKRATAKYMPYVNLETFQSFIDRNENKEVGKVGLKITYKVPRIDNTLRSLEIMLYVGG
tara:strand:- start:195 stop:710 length:516 start_codon:yes stop_codon:yes gene_type:complete